MSVANFPGSPGDQVAILENVTAACAAGEVRFHVVVAQMRDGSVREWHSGMTSAIERMGLLAWAMKYSDDEISVEREQPA